MDRSAQARIEELKKQIREIARQDTYFGTLPENLHEDEETVLRRILAYESTPRRELREVLVQSGIQLPAPEHLSDDELHVVLWQVIYELVVRRIVISKTDHLSDRDLYTLLWNKTLRQELPIELSEPSMVIQIDMTSLPDYQEGLRVYLKYYATEDERFIFAMLHPHFRAPGHCEPPARRDHLIPAFRDCAHRVVYGAG